MKHLGLNHLQADRDSCDTRMYFLWECFKKRNLQKLILNVLALCPGEAIPLFDSLDRLSEPRDNGPCGLPAVAQAALTPTAL